MELAQNAKRICFLASVVLFFVTTNVQANNVTVTNISLVGNSEIDGNPHNVSYKYVQFDIAWENSWRVATGPSNWDACWVFIKYKKTTESIWKHASLGTVDANHFPSSGSAISATADGRGVFVYGASTFNGNVNYTETNVRWNIATDGLSETDEVEICVYAIEMVYVPQGSFYLGDGASTSIQGHFRAQASNVPYQITSENGLTLGGSDAASLNNNNASGMAGGSLDDFNNTTSQTLPNEFPKGFNAFYCMKYEATQIQYVEFLNKLTRIQQNNRTETNLAVGVTSVTNRYVMTNNSSVLQRNGIRCNATIDATNPITFYCDLNANGVGNESDDGMDLPANRVSWADASAYLDWAGLRPLSEFEFEKASRGHLTPVTNEFPWGTTSITRATARINAGTATETTSTANANAVFDDSFGTHGSYRVGCFGQGVNTRVAVGATYYGILNFAGNLWERTISVGNATGRTFTGQHGNGILDTNGNADASNWPGSNAVGTGLRGGGYLQAANALRISNRFNGAAVLATRTAGSTYGIRGVRTAP